MFTGIVLIIAGVLIAIYPPLLAWVVAFFLITLGALVATSAHYHRKHAHRMDNPVVEFIFAISESLILSIGIGSLGKLTGAAITLPVLSPLLLAYFMDVARY